MKFLLIAFAMSAGHAHATTPLEAVKSLLGTYTGHWEMYDLDSSGKVQMTMAWDDVISLTDAQVGVDPMIGKQRAFANVKDVLNVTFPKVATYQVNFTEGFETADDGSAGNHYFTFRDSTGKVSETSESEDAKNLYHYESEVTVEKYSGLGITRTNVIFAKNYTVKAVTLVNGTERQDISQTTTLIWRATDGSVKSRQFVSMVGVHQRTLN